MPYFLTVKSKIRQERSERLGKEDEGEIVGENVGLPTRVGSHTKVPLFRASPITNKREGRSRTQTKSEGRYSLGWKNPRSVPYPNKG